MIITFSSIIVGVWDAYPILKFLVMFNKEYSLLLNKTLPLLGFIKPEIKFKIDVFPDPLAP